MKYRVTVEVDAGIADSRASHVTARRDWDHGAPKQGVWWMNEMTMEMEKTDG